MKSLIFDSPNTSYAKTGRVFFAIFALALAATLMRPSATAAQPTHTYSLGVKLKGDLNLSAFYDALESTGIISELHLNQKDGQAYTIFAPFSRNQAAQRKRLSKPKNKKERKKLRALLLNHIVKGRYDVKRLRKTDRVTTLAGHKMSIEERSVDGNKKFFINDAPFIETEDIVATNGIMHSVDGYFDGK